MLAPQMFCIDAQVSPKLHSSLSHDLYYVTEDFSRAAYAALLWKTL